MTAYSLARPEPSLLTRVVSAAAEFVAGLVRAHRSRREVAELLHADSRMLADIGLTRYDVIAALTAADDAGNHLAERAAERREAAAASARERARVVRWIVPGRTNAA